MWSGRCAKSIRMASAPRQNSIVSQKFAPPARSSVGQSCDEVPASPAGLEAGPLVGARHPALEADRQHAVEDVVRLGLDPGGLLGIEPDLRGPDLVGVRLVRKLVDEVVGDDVVARRRRPAVSSTISTPNPSRRRTFGMRSTGSTTMSARMCSQRYRVRRRSISSPRLNGSVHWLTNIGSSASSCHGSWSSATIGRSGCRSLTAFQSEMVSCWTGSAAISATRLPSSRRISRSRATPAICHSSRTPVVSHSGRRGPCHDTSRVQDYHNQPLVYRFFAPSVAPFRRRDVHDLGVLRTNEQGWS